MKLNPINKNRVISKTPLNFWIKSATVILTAGTFAIGAYIINLQSDSYLGKAASYTSNILQDFENKLAIKNQKPLEQHSYREYLKERKTYRKQLEEESNQRLELLKSIKLENLEEELKKKKLLEEQKAQALQSPILSENPTRNSSVETAKSSGWNIKQPNKMDESIDEFKENFKLIKEKKMKIAQISRYLSPTPKPTAEPSTSQPTTSENVSSNESTFKKSSSTSSFDAKLSKKSDSKPKKPEISKYFERKVNKFNCPICSTDLSEASENERQVHVNSCLDQGFKSKPKKFSNLSESVCENELEKCKVKQPIEKVEKVKEETVSSDNPIETQNLNLSTPQTSKSTNEETPSAQSKAPTDILKDAVPNCPICGKVLHTMNMRQTHMKKCAQIFHIKTESLVELVKKQQLQIESDLARGLIPSDVYFPKQSKKKEEKKKTKVTNRVIKLETPINKQDEHLQLAIALSNSLNEKDQEQHKHLVLKPKAELKSGKNSKQIINKLESALVLTDDETRVCIISKRFSNILSNTIDYAFESNDLERISSKKRFVKTKFNTDSNYLWNKCRYFLESDECFYVRLFLEKANFQVGGQVFVEKPDEEKFENVEVLNTQTAFILAELNQQTQEDVSIYYTQLSQNINRTQYNDYKQNNSIDFDAQSIAIKESQNPKEDFSEEEILINTEKENQEDTSAESFEEPVERAEEDIIAPSQLNRLFEDSLMNKKDINTRNIFDSSIICESDLNETGAIVCIDETKLSPSSKSSSSSCLESLNDNGTSDTAKKSNNEVADRVSILHDEIVLDDLVDHVEQADDDNYDENNQDELEMNIIDSNSKSNTEESRHSHHSIESNDHLLGELLDKADVENEKSLNIEKNEPSQTSQRSVLMNSDNGDDEIVIEDEIPSNESNRMCKFAFNTSSKKRKSIDIIQLDEQSYHLDDSELPNLDNYETTDKNTSKLDVIYENFDLERNKKPKLDSSTSKEMVDAAELCSIDECIVNTSPQAKFYESQSQISFSQLDSADRNQQKAQVDAQFEGQIDYDPLEEVWKNYCEDHYEFNACNQNDDDYVTENKYDQMSRSPDTESDKESIVNSQNRPSFKSPETAPLIVNQKKPPMPISKKPPQDLKTPEPKRPIVNKRVENLMNSEEGSLTPMPNYQEMNSPFLKDHLKKYGLKALPKKQAIKKLVEIYEYTHRHKLSKLKKSYSCMDLDQDVERAAKDMNLESSGKNSKTKKKTLKKTVSDVNLTNKPESSYRTSATTSSKNKIKELVAHECTLDEKLLELAEQDSEESDSSPHLLLTATQKRQRKTLDENELKQVVYEYIKNDPNLHLSVLNYDPLDFEQFMNNLQTQVAPKKVNSKSLMKILDNFCVTFTLKSLNTRGANSKVRSKKKH